MKFSQKWLQQLVQAQFTTKTLVDQLTMAGLEVDAIEPIANKFTEVVVGEILEVKPHPNADKLQICIVDVGESEVLNIVCGAKNVCAGLKVAVAKVGALLADDFKIKKAKLRGVESFGMICSASELGLEKSSAGIMQLPQNAPIGEDFVDYFDLDDVSLDVSLTPNRGDCASIIGVAREVAALNSCKYLPPKIKTIKPKIKESLKVNIKNPQACSRYVGRVITNINLNATTPLWMKERLRRSGLNSIDPVVDVTNYVMLELGQPMHAFDLQKIAKHIEVRFAEKNEKLILLDNTEVSLSQRDLVIADSKQALALAGVMGGKHSAINADTKDIFLESAFFDQIQVAETARRHSLQTDSSYRFERGVDFIKKHC